MHKSLFWTKERSLSMCCHKESVQLHVHTYTDNRSSTCVLGPLNRDVLQAEYKNTDKTQTYKASVLKLEQLLLTP